jgi:hypothetical protein
MQLTCIVRHPPDIEQHALVGIDMPHALQWTCGTQCDAQLLMQLACECLGHCLTDINLAAWEFPLPALVLVLWTLCDEDLMLRVLDDADRDRGYVRYGTRH